jgi:uncharacterized protein (DUF58 family)
VSAETEGLLDPAFLARLGRLRLRSRRPFRGHDAGERRSKRHGAGLEFAGHRSYAAGDDLRQLDWALLARLDRPFMKVYEQEADLTVHLLIDGSRSMGFGIPSKHLAASRLAAALAYIALGSLDRVGVGFFGGGGMRVHGPARGHGAFFRLLQFLESGAADLSGGLGSGLKLHATAAKPGLTFVISDFLDPAYRELLRPHQARRHSLVLVQVLAPEELDPPLEGDLKLIDSETGEEVELTIGYRERKAYLRRLEAQREVLRALALKHAMDLVFVPADLPLEEALWDRVLPAVTGPGR